MYAVSTTQSTTAPDPLLSDFSFRLNPPRQFRPQPPRPIRVLLSNTPGNSTTANLSADAPALSARGSGAYTSTAPSADGRCAPSNRQTRPASKAASPAARPPPPSTHPPRPPGRRHPSSERPPRRRPAPRPANAHAPASPHTRARPTDASAAPFPANRETSPAPRSFPDTAAGRSN